MGKSVEPIIHTIWTDGDARVGNSKTQNSKPNTIFALSVAFFKKPLMSPKDPAKSSEIRPDHKFLGCEPTWNERQSCRCKTLGITGMAVGKCANRAEKRLEKSSKNSWNILSKKKFKIMQFIDLKTQQSRIYKNSNPESVTYAPWPLMKDQESIAAGISDAR